MGSLDDEKLGIDLLLSSRISVRVIFESCATKMLVRPPRKVGAQRNLTKSTILLLDVGYICIWRQIQVCIVILGRVHGRV